MKKLSIVVLISGNGSNLQSIIDAVEAGQINGQITAVISNKADAYGLERAKKHNIDQQVISHKNFSSREDFDLALSKSLSLLNPDIIVLAGFMRILGSALIQAFERKILNIHPSILPSYKGLNTFQRAIDNKEREHGVSIHIVTPELDDGPVIVRGRYPILTDDRVSDLQGKGHRLEHRIYPQVLRWLGQGDLQISANTITFQDKLLERPIEFEDRETP
ncbi:MAG: phosphoribosylglycinamide formyltransferase-1 [Gammaproteobacteria bacterium]|jgi:phosphoribosylglycinamide formyltransferase-1